MHSASDRNLLFGVLALQMDCIELDQLAAAMKRLATEKQKDLGDVLVESGSLEAAKRCLLELLVDAHIAQHQNDPQQSLREIRSGTKFEKILDTLVEGGAGNGSESPAEDGGHSENYDTILAPCRPTDSVSRYRVVRNHASGGLGTVYVAIDGELNREVALKEIKPPLADDPNVRARFTLEAEITGGLEHPGIVPVYGLGVYPDGRPYYAMRLVRGDSLKDAIREYHESKFSGDSEKNLVFRNLLKRFVDACNAIAYAHSRGVLHRDLKPANIMLGKYGETLVVDWGMAKIESSSSDDPPPLDEVPLKLRAKTSVDRTEMGTVMGTLSYMSPEQALGRLDTLGPATDVFGLGATLYTLLTGEPPYKGPADIDIMSRIRAARFSRPRDVQRGIPPALEAICLRAMAALPKDRYSTPTALAQDVERYMADEPLAAYREPTLDRIQRWVRKHPAPVSGVVAALIVGALSLGAGLFFVDAERARTESARLDADRLFWEAKEQAQLAQENQKIAEKQKELAFTKAAESQATSDFMSDVFGAADPLGLAGSASLSARDGKAVSARDLLDRGVANVNSRFQDRPLVRAKMLEALGAAYRGLNDFERAEELLKDSLDIRQKLLGENDVELSGSWHHYGILMLHVGRFEEAQRALERALRIREQSFPPTDPRRLESMLVYAWALSGNMSGDHDQERQQQAQTMLRDVIEQQTARLGADHRDVAIAQLALAAVQLTRDSTGEQAKAILTQLQNNQNWSFAPIVADFLLAEQLRRFGNLEAAEAKFGSIDKKLTTLVGENHVYKLAFDASHANLLRQLNRGAEGERLILSVFERVRLSPLRWHPLAAKAMLQAAEHFRTSGNTDEARRLFSEALTIAEKSQRAELAVEARRKLDELGVKP